MVCFARGGVLLLRQRAGIEMPVENQPDLPVSCFSFPKQPSKWKDIHDVCVCVGGFHCPQPTLNYATDTSIYLLGHCLATASPTHPQVTPQLSQRVLLHPTTRTPTHLCQDHDQGQVAAPSACLCVLIAMLGRAHNSRRARPVRQSQR
jgi:hypothetical protein